MNRVKNGDRFLLLNEMDINGLIHWAAPYGTGFSCTLPRGTMVIALGDQVDGAEGFSAIPEHDRIVADLFIDQFDRSLKKYQGFSFVFNISELGKNLKPLDRSSPGQSEASFRQALALVLEKRNKRRERLRGLMIGTAVGDSLGLPFEGLGPGRVKRLIKHGISQVF